MNAHTYPTPILDGAATLPLLALAAPNLGPAAPPQWRAAGPIPPIVWLWIAGMAVMLVALWVGHLDWELGAGQTIKSTIGWAKGWALMALFPLVGAVLPIRRHALIRSQTIVGLCTLLVLPIMLVAPMIGLPEKLFESRLKAAGGPGPEYVSVDLYTLDPSTWTPRWQFYAPWSPFAGLIGVVLALFALEEKKRFWIIVGLLAALAMIYLSKSRMSSVALVVCVIVPRLLPFLRQSVAWSVFAAAAASLAVLGTDLLRLMQDGVSAFKGARADSTRVREALQRIAYDRWRSEAVWFGHGTVEPGPHIVERMPIGSHHTWFGLLFVKGVVGLFALLVPMSVHTILTFADAAKGPRGRLPFGIMLLLVILTFGENVEIEAYLLWPALVLLGVPAREMNSSAASGR